MEEKLLTWPHQHSALTTLPPMYMDGGLLTHFIRPSYTGANIDYQWRGVLSWLKNTSYRR